MIRSPLPEAQLWDKLNTLVLLVNPATLLWLSARRILDPFNGSHFEHISGAKPDQNQGAALRYTTSVVKWERSGLGRIFTTGSTKGRHWCKTQGCIFFLVRQPLRWYNFSTLTRPPSTQHKPPVLTITGAARDLSYCN